jgi:hypothetical protein
MEKRALVVALILALPLALYGIPYAYAASIVTTYAMDGPTVLANPGIEGVAYADCKSGDVATGGGLYNNIHTSGSSPILMASEPTVFDGVASHDYARSGQTPNSWSIAEQSRSSDTSNLAFGAYVVCMTPITVAGIGVPQFGSFYFAIALGAVLYFLMARRFAGRPTISA